MWRRCRGTTEWDGNAPGCMYCQLTRLKDSPNQKSSIQQELWLVLPVLTTWLRSRSTSLTWGHVLNGLLTLQLPGWILQIYVLNFFLQLRNFDHMIRWWSFVHHPSMSGLLICSCENWACLLMELSTQPLRKNNLHKYSLSMGTNNRYLTFWSELKISSWGFLPYTSGVKIAILFSNSRLGWCNFLYMKEWVKLQVMLKPLTLRIQSPISLCKSLMTLLA